MRCRVVLSFPEHREIHSQQDRRATSSALASAGLDGQSRPKQSALHSRQSLLHFRLCHFRVLGRVQLEPCPSIPLSACFQSPLLVEDLVQTQARRGGDTLCDSRGSSSACQRSFSIGMTDSGSRSWRDEDWKWATRETGEHLRSRVDVFYRDEDAWTELQVRERREVLGEGYRSGVSVSQAAGWPQG
jgi:hypothetical protein